MNRRMIATPRLTVATLPRLAVILLVAMACFAISPNAYARRDKPAKFGQIQVTTPTGSYPIILDDDPNGSGFTSPAGIVFNEVKPGRHKIEVLMPDGSRWTREIEISAGRLYCVGVTYRKTEKHCWDYPITATLTQTSQGGDVAAFKSNVNYSGPSPLNYTWTVNPSTVSIVSGGAGSPDITINTAGVTGLVTVRLVVDADDGSGDARCRQEAVAEFNIVGCTATPITASIASEPYFKKGESVSFTANTQYAGTNTLRYNWTVSPDSARIASGQGTPSITVDTAGVGSNQHITASLRITDGSNDPNCEAKTEATADTCYDCFDYVKMNDLKARLDNFAIELQNTPGATGQVYVHGPLREAQSVGGHARDYLIGSRGLEGSRVNVEPIADSRKIHIEMYVVKIGAPRPEPNLSSVSDLPQPRGIQHIPRSNQRRSRSPRR
jgi:hypothetical protein